MKSLIFIAALIISMTSCNSSFDVIVHKSNDVVFKYKCESGKDTLNSVRYVYYKSLLRIKVPLKDGKIDGTVINYYPDGGIDLITNYRNGIAQGINKKFSENGTLMRKSMYINNRQVLFENRMINSERTINRRKLYYRINNKQTWGGELYSYINDSLGKGKYKGMYIDMFIDETIAYATPTPVELKFTLPETSYDPKILIGDFDENLNCIDTIYFANPDSVYDQIFFDYQPDKTGNNYLIGKMVFPEFLDIYFFEGFYVKKE